MVVRSPYGRPHILKLTQQAQSVEAKSTLKALETSLNMLFPATISRLPRDKFLYEKARQIARTPILLLQTLLSVHQSIKYTSVGGVQ